MSQPATENPVTDPQDPTVDPQGDPTNPDPQDPAGDETDPRVKRANAQAANYRTQLRAEQDARAALEAKLTEQGDTLAKLASVFNPDAPQGADPTEQLATITGEADKLRGEVTELRAELVVHRLAGKHNGDAVKLLDSRTFTQALYGLDPSAPDYQDQVAQAIQSAVSDNASLAAAAGQGPSRGGAPGAGQGPAQPAGAVTQEQFNAMGLGQRSELFRNNPDLYRTLAAAIR